MSLLLPLDAINEKARPRVGGKALALAEMRRAGLSVPDGLAIATDAYERYVDAGGLRERVLLELNRKPFADMRWEELWDAALRIRNLFLTAELPADLRQDLHAKLADRFGDRPVVVRSSAPAEDSATASFAGLHESYVNVAGAEAVLDHVRLVWASLWSDRALLYRQELGLDAERSVIAVVVQELVTGQRSGVAFSRSPMDATQAIVEAVHGLNQGLVDGTVEPDRWVIRREGGRILSHTPTTREQAVVPSAAGVSLTPLSPDQAAVPPLSDDEVGEVYELARRSEEHFGAPQDVEWTYDGDRLWLLQSRPVTTSSANGDDTRRWYLSLTRSFENLKQLWRRIEDELLPAMDAEAAQLAQQDLEALTDAELADQLAERREAYQKWRGVYWDDFIPFAHGARLFGQVYNDAMRPDDPFEFTRLLAATEMISLARNHELARLASMIRDDEDTAEQLRSKGSTAQDGAFERALSAFLARYSLVPAGLAGEREGLVRLLLEMAGRPPTAKRVSPADAERLRADFLARFEGQERVQSEELLELGRASYRLRDNDNIHLRKVEDEWLRASAEAQGRLVGGEAQHGHLAEALRQADGLPEQRRPEADLEPGVSARQLLGQPAGQGIATGPARVLDDTASLFDVQSGDVLVCDAVDPNMTFVVPLAAAIVERRGGMLIHGAIIAREYGLPCVTGVPNATALIETGDTVTVDGYLGIVTVAR